jgi:hypothetical protein
LAPRSKIRPGRRFPARGPGDRRSGRCGSASCRPTSCEQRSPAPPTRPALAERGPPSPKQNSLSWAVSVAGFPSGRAVPTGSRRPSGPADRAPDCVLAGPSSDDRSGPHSHRWPRRSSFEWSFRCCTFGLASHQATPDPKAVETTSLETSSCRCCPTGSCCRSADVPRAWSSACRPLAA